MDEKTKNELLWIARKQLAGAQVDVIKDMFIKIDEQEREIVRIEELREAQANLTRETKEKLREVTEERDELRRRVEKAAELDEREYQVRYREQRTEIIDARMVAEKEKRELVVEMFNTVFRNSVVKRQVLESHQQGVAVPNDHYVTSSTESHSEEATTTEEG